VEITAQELAAAIAGIAEALPDLQARAGIRQYWAERYDAKVVHERFAKDLLDR
jgi:hypothetical protein